MRNLTNSEIEIINKSAENFDIDDNFIKLYRSDTNFRAIVDAVAETVYMLEIEIDCQNEYYTIDKNLSTEDLKIDYTCAMISDYVG